MHGCNNQGVMGAGFAKTIKEKYPEVFTTYIQDIALGRTSLGFVSWQQVYGQHTMVASGITQEFYGRSGCRYASYDAIDIVMHRVFKYAFRERVEIHMPKIGAGLGGGDWRVIESIIGSAADSCAIDSNNIFIWEL